jgi:hypothetical protein
MNKVEYYARLLISIGYFVLGVRMLNHDYLWASRAAILISAVVLFPVVWMNYKRRKPAPAASFWKADAAARFRWIRKGTALFLGLIVVGALQRGKYPEAIAVGSICTIFLSPLDTLLFYAPTPHPFFQPIQSVRYIVIIGLRNSGWVLYAIGAFSFVDHKKDQEDIAFMAVGIAMMFTRAVVLMLVPNRPPAPAATVPALPIETVPLPQQQQETSKPDLATLKADYLALSSLAPQARGYAFQRFLHQLFEAHHLIARNAFRLTGEEIDGSFDLGNQTYLLEAKWQAKPTAQNDLLVFNGKVEGKSTWARGLFISYAGFTADGLIAFRHGKRTSIIGMDGNDLLLILDGVITLEDAIRRKVMKAVEGNDFFVPLAGLA